MVRLRAPLMKLVWAMLPIVAIGTEMGRRWF
jgi:hypothetical protein